jgi:predicted ester cyclase
MSDRGRGAVTLYQRFVADLWRDDAPVEALAAELVTPDFVVHQARADGTPSEARRGPDALATLVAESLALFSNVTVTVEAGPVADGDLIAARWRFTGDYRGGIPGAGAEPGTRVSFCGHDLFQVSGGRFAEYWTSSDGLHLMAQLGLGG